jgi:hypothetical protein
MAGFSELSACPSDAQGSNRHSLRTTISKEELHMRLEEIKDTIMSMDTGEQKRLIMEVVPQVWGRVSDDTSCVMKL